MTTKTPSKRLYALDTYKSIIIVLMIFVHVVEELLAPSPLVQSIYNYYDLYWPIACSFMFCMGIGFILSRNSDNYSSYIKRGATMFLLSYVFNFARAGVPMIINSLINGTPLDTSYMILWLLTGDILQFAGLALICWGAIVYLKMHKSITKIMIIALVVGAINMILTKIPVVPGPHNSILGLFWASNGAQTCQYAKDMCFPLLGWFIYPLAGAIFTLKLKTITNRDQFFGKILISSIALFAIITTTYSLLGISWNDATIYEYYYQTLKTSIILLPIIMIQISLFYYIEKFLALKDSNILHKWGNDLTPIYIAQWMIIGWIEFLFIPSVQFPSQYVIPIVLGIFMLSLLCVSIYKKVMK